MPPPRRTLPLRPWHPPRTSVHARWASQGPRAASNEQPDDGAPGGRDEGASTRLPAEGPLTHQTDTADAPQNQKAAGRWPALASSLKLLSKTPSSSPSPSPETPAEPARSPPPPADPPSGTTCLVCAHDFRSPLTLRHHIIKNNHIASWPVVYTSLDEVLQERSKKLRFDFAGWNSPWSKTRFQDVRGEAIRSCSSCSTRLRSLEEVTLHMLSSKQCIGPKPSSFVCVQCEEIFDTPEQAHRHVQSSPACVTAIKTRPTSLDPRSMSALNDKRLIMADHVYRSYLELLVGIYSDLEAMASPVTAPITRTVYAYLYPVFVHAKNTKRHSILRYFYGNLQLRRELYGSPSSIIRQLLIQYTASLSALLDVSRALATLPSSLTAGMMKSTIMYIRPIHREAKKRQDAFLLPILEEHAAILDVKKNKSRKVHPGPTERESSFPAKDKSTTTVKVPSSSEEGHLVPETKEPPVPNENQQPDESDLKLQLNQLMEQVRLLQEKLGVSQVSTDTTSPGNASQENSEGSQVSPDKSLLEDINQSSPPAPGRRYASTIQAQLVNQKIRASLAGELPLEEIDTLTPPSDLLSSSVRITENVLDGQRLVRQTHTQAKSMDPSEDLNTNEIGNNVPAEAEADQAEPTMLDLSLLDELFPEARNYIQPHYTKRNPYPRLDLPSSAPLVRMYSPKKKLTSREKYIQAFQNSSEMLSALQLLYCSTELTEADFRRVIPQGRHIEGWARDGEIHKIIPGRDPLSLERLPFYYLVFKNPEAALKYQNNAARLHKLSQLYGYTNAVFAIPPPPGLLENGEDIHAALSSYSLMPPGQDLHLNMVMQPYNPSLSRLIEQGGYPLIASATTSTDKQIHKVLLHIEGYEPSPYDVYQVLMQDAAMRGIAWPFVREHQSVYRLRDVMDIKTRFRSVSTAKPRAARTDRNSHDPYAEFLGHNSADESEDDNGQDAKAINQLIMNRVYNRWIIEFSDEDAAKRFARLWHRKILPMQASVKHRTWRDLEEARMCNTEYLW